jgi:predicted dehydrogenase
LKPIRMSVIGLGQLGLVWIENLLADPRYEVSAIIDTDEERIHQACSKFDLNEKIAFTSLEKGISDTKLDAALIVVPPQFHYSTAKYCIENKLQILSEKPLACSMGEALSIKKLCNQQKILFMVSQDYRWQPPIQSLRESIANGLIGKPGYAVYRHYRSLKIGGWREQMEDVILEDMAIHHFDILRYITRLDCEEVFAESFNPTWSWYHGGASTSVLLTFKEEFHVNYFASWVTTGREDSWPGEIRIEGEKGSLFLNTNGEVKFYQNGIETTISQPEMDYSGRRYALHQFYNGVSHSGVPDSTIEDNIKSFAIVQAAIESAQSKKTVRIDRLLNPELELLV